jgi:hypothetical protein
MPPPAFPLVTRPRKSVITFVAAPSFHGGSGSDGAWAREMFFANLILNFSMLWNKRPAVFCRPLPLLFCNRALTFAISRCDRQFWPA